MDDLSEKISALLSDEDTVNELKTLADSLGFDTSSFGAPGKKAAAEPTQKKYEKDNSPLSSLGIDAGTLLKLTSALGSKKNDDDAALLRALKPHLSEEKRGRVDSAVKIIRLLNLLPLLKELNLFGGDNDG